MRLVPPLSSAAPAAPGGATAGVVRTRRIIGWGSHSLLRWSRRNPPTGRSAATQASATAL